MKFKADVVPYLKGERFSNGARIGFDFDAEDRRYRSRIEWLERLCLRRRVIHVGCVDHSIDQIKHKLTRNKWVHARLANVADRCLGIDLNAEGIAFLQDELGYRDTAVLDLLHGDVSALRETTWHDLLLGEVLEHVGDPVTFLRTIKARLAGCVDRLMVTVPNALSEESHRAASQSTEVINTDHRYWFTPYTLAKIVTDAGYDVECLRLARNGVIKRRSVLQNWFYARKPLFRNNLILLAKFSA